MSFLYLFLYCILAVFIICAFVSIIQFFIDLHRCSALKSELNELINRAKLADAEPLNNAEVKNDTN